MCTDRIEQVIQEVGELKKCCETCEFYQIKGMEDCGNVQVPHIEFEASDGDPAEFWCNHWQQKEEQK